MLNETFSLAPSIFQFDPSSPLTRNMVVAAPLTSAVRTIDTVTGKKAASVGTTYTTSRAGNVATFAGAEQVTFSRMDMLLDSKVFTVSFWTKVDAGPSSWFWCSAQNGGSAGFGVDFSVSAANKIGWTKNGVVSRQWAWTRDTNIHHFCFTSDQSNVTFYLDGVSQGPLVNTGGLLTSGGPGIGVGYRNINTGPDFFFSGKIWSFCLWNRRSFNGSEVRQMYMEPFFYLQQDATQRVLVTDMPGGGGGGAVKLGYAPGWMWD